MESKHQPGKGVIAVPASTASPLILAVGVTLLLAGLVTNAVISATGALLLVAGVVGWFRQVLPHEAHESIAVEPPAARVARSAHAVTRLAAGEPRHRSRLPVAIYPYSAGVKGGIAGGVAMAALALLHGVINHQSLWYTVNLLAAGASPSLANADAATLAAFSATGLLLALFIHGALSLLVGLLYGVLLPMVPGHPAWWGGLVAPLLWTALLASSLGVLNPALNARIEWPWFIASQIAFGVVAGFVVVRSEQIATFQHDALAQRARLETRDE